MVSNNKTLSEKRLDDCIDNKVVGEHLNAIENGLQQLFGTLVSPIYGNCLVFNAHTKLEQLEVTPGQGYTVKKL